jgi:ABC-2 type transport system permease protein
MNYIKELLSARELFVNLSLREIKGKYKRTVFGQLWSLVNPLAMMLIYTFVFALIFRIHPEPGDPSGLDVFALWLMCGLLPWLFFSGVVSLGASSLVQNAPLIQKVYFPRVVLPIAQVGARGFSWLFEMAVLIAALAVFGSFVWPWLPLVIVVMLLLAIFAAGAALIFSILNVYFRDTEHLLTILFQIWMYLTPIIYPISFVEKLSADVGGIFGSPITILGIYNANPMVHFVAVFRQLLYDNRWPDGIQLAACAAWALGTFVVGLWVFRRNERGLAEAL